MLTKIKDTVALLNSKVEQVEKENESTVIDFS